MVGIPLVNCCPIPTCLRAEHHQNRPGLDTEVQAPCTALPSHPASPQNPHVWEWGQMVELVLCRDGLVGDTHSCLNDVDCGRNFGSEHAREKIV